MAKLGQCSPALPWEENMWKLRFAGGLLMMVAAAILMLFAREDVSLPVALGLLVVGIALVATARRWGKQQA